MGPQCVSRVLRRAVLFHLSLASPALVGCGGGTAPLLADGGERGVDAQGAEAAVPSCSIVSPPSGGPNGTCSDGISYQFDGTFDQCVGSSGDAGTLDDITLSTCEALCPPVSDAGAFAYVAGFPLSGCMLVNSCDQPPCIPMELECEYDLCSDASGPILGRRPRGLRRRHAYGSERPVARELARMAHFEAASVPAFERLARELEAHGAPRRLCRAAVRAASDEVRHARVATTLARRAGAAVRKPIVRKSRDRSLVAMAIENAVEGCVNETFAAAMAMAQSLTAKDASVRAAIGPIARDEMRHAQLAWSVAAWLDTRLKESERASVRRAQNAAVKALVVNASRAVEHELVEELGLPPPSVARALALELASALWSGGIKSPGRLSATNGTWDRDDRKWA